jgi:hypothetical protein
MQCLANEEGYEVIGTWKEGELVLGVYSIIDVLADGRNLRRLYHTVLVPNTTLPSKYLVVLIHVMCILPTSTPGQVAQLAENTGIHLAA